MDLESSNGRDEQTNTLVKVAMDCTKHTTSIVSFSFQILKYGDEDIEQLVQSALKQERAMVTMTTCIAAHHSVAMAA